MIEFTYFQKYIKVEIKDTAMPVTMIKCEDSSNEAVLKTCQSWLDAFGLTDKEYTVSIRLH